MRVSELRGALEGALGPIYRVEREVRPVGECRRFGAVGPPADPELLVKVLPAEVSLAVDGAVFERELLLLGDRLGHAQLVPPRGGGRAGAFVFHTRRFVDGTTLRAWLLNNGEMPLRPVIEVLRDVLLALAHAHRGNTAHRDLTHADLLPAEAWALGGPTRRRPWTRSVARARGRCERRPGALLSPGRRATRAGRHAGGPCGVRPSDVRAGEGRLEDAQLGSVRPPTPTRQFRIPHSALRIVVDLRRRLRQPRPARLSGLGRARLQRHHLPDHRPRRRHQSLGPAADLAPPAPSRP